jgi:hypothetical protein
MRCYRLEWYAPVTNSVDVCVCVCMRMESNVLFLDK